MPRKRAPPIRLFELRSLVDMYDYLKYIAYLLLHRFVQYCIYQILSHLFDSIR